jgi:hypothetical protein
MNPFRKLFGAPAPSRPDPLGNLNPAARETLANGVHAACFMWPIWLTRDEQNRPEAAAVLMGILDAATKDFDLSALQLLYCARVALRAMDESGHWLKVDPDMLVDRMSTATRDPDLLPWLCFAGRKVRACMKDPQWSEKMLDVELDILAAVKDGTFDDPGAHAVAEAALRLHDGARQSP